MKRFLKRLVYVVNVGAAVVTVVDFVSKVVPPIGPMLSSLFSSPAWTELPRLMLGLSVAATTWMMWTLSKRQDESERLALRAFETAFAKRDDRIARLEGEIAALKRGA